jgi:hypothetical protein
MQIGNKTKNGEKHKTIKARHIGFEVRKCDASKQWHVEPLDLDEGRDIKRLMRRGWLLVACRLRTRQGRRMVDSIGHYTGKALP